MERTTEIPRQETYQQLLNSYLDCGGEGPLTIAYEFVRQNLQNGMSLLEVVETHHQALDRTLRLSGDSASSKSAINEAASRFFSEALSPFEITRLSSRDTNEALLKLYDVFENEAKRIAYRLHDESAQMLAVVYLELAEIAKQSSTSMAERVGVVVGHLDEVTSQLRTLSHELRPIVLDQLGLMPAIRTLITGVMKRHDVRIEVSGDTHGRLDSAIETVAYRTVQEAVANICRHAQATHASIRVQREDNYLLCSVSDDGKGFSAQQNVLPVSQGLGLIGIDERVRALGGECEITSRPGFGTTLKARIPLCEI